MALKGMHRTTKKDYSLSTRHVTHFCHKRKIFDKKKNKRAALRLSLNYFFSIYNMLAESNIFYYINNLLSTL